MKLKGFAIVSIILLAIITFGAVNAADNVTADDLAVVSDGEDFDLSLSSEEIINEEVAISKESGDILGASDTEVIITPGNISQFDTQVEKGNYKFIGDFNRSFSYLSFESGCRIDASQAKFIDMGIVLPGDVQINGLTISTTHYNQFYQDALVYVTGDDNILKNLNVDYAPDAGHDVYAILFNSANDFQLLDSTINFTGSSLSKYYEYAMKIDSCVGGLIQSNTIQANLPILNVDYPDDATPKLESDLVLNTGIKDSNNINIIGNTFIANVNNRFGDYPTLDCVMLESCEKINITNNILKEYDFITPAGTTNYLNVLDMYYSSNVLVKGNNISVETDGGSVDAGTAYPIQISGPYEGVLIDGNHIYARCGGPALGLFSQNYYGDTEILVQNNNIDVTGLSTLNSWGLVSGIELQDNMARVYNNTIKTKSISGYTDGMRLYGISYAQALNNDHNYDIRSNNIETEGKYAIYILKAENTNITDNYLVSSTGVGNQTIYIVNATGTTVIRDNKPEKPAENVVTASNFDNFFDDDGILKDVEFDELIFKGQLNSLRERIYITKALTITGDDAVLTNMAIDIQSDNVKLDKLTLTADTCLGKLINVKDANGIDLTNIHISYSPGSEEAVALHIQDSDDIKLSNSVIFFESHVRDDSVQSIAVQVVNSNNVLMDLNEITTKLPAITVNEYDKDYYMMGSNNVNPVRLKDCSNLVFTRNKIDSATNELIAEFPTIQSIYIIGCSDSLIDHNNISMIDEVTPVGRDNYMYGIDFGFNVNVTFSYNNFLMITSGGKDAAGTDYAFQGVESEVIIRGNNIVSRSNGPNLGIYVASMSGGASKLLIEDNIINITGFSSSKGTWALVSGIEIQNGDAQIYNNTIDVYNVNSYDDNAYIYGVSYAQWMYGDRSFDIRDNVINTQGKYAVSVINASSLRVENNELYAHELEGDDSVSPGACEKVSVKNNNLGKPKIIIDVDDCWFGNNNGVNITVVNRTGSITINVNGNEVATKQIDSTTSYDIQAKDIVLGKNTVEVIFNGMDSKSASFVAYDQKSVIEINVGAASIGRDVPVTVSIPGASGNVNVIVDGKENSIELKDGVATYTIEKITSGKHDIVAVYMGDGIKLPAVNTTVFTVEKTKPLVLITSVGVQYAKKPFSIKIMAEVPVNVTINGKSYDLVGGNINIDSGLDAGEYTVLVVSAETERYYAHSVSSTFTVVKYNSTIDVKSASVMQGEELALEITVTDGATGGVLVDVGDNKYYGTINNGKATVNVIGLNEGDYTAVITYSGDDKFNPSSSNVDIKVTAKEDVNVTIDVPSDVKAGQNATIGVNMGDATGNVSVIVDGNEYDKVLVEGFCSVKLDNVSAGVHGVVVIYSGDEKHNSAYVTSSFDVAGEPVRPKEKINATIDVSDVKVGEDAIVNVTLTADATGTVAVYVDGKKSAECNVENGTLSVSVGQLTAGNHIVEARYSGDDKYSSVSETKDINVAKLNATVKADDIEVTEGETASLTVNVDGVATGVVFVNVGGKQFYGIIESGKANIDVVGLGAANYTAEISYQGDDRFAESFTTANVKVNSKPAEKKGSVISITEVRDTTIYGVLKELNGNPIANAVVDYEINANKSSVVTGNDGTFAIAGQKGVKTSISYDGDNGTLAFNTSITVDFSATVRTGTVISGDDFTQYAVESGAGERGQDFTAQLKDAKGNVLANKTVMMSYNGKLLQKTTDSNGYISEQINIKDAGTLTSDVVFLGDNGYDATMSVYSITINKKPVTIAASAKTFKGTAKTKKYVITLKTIKGSSADGKTYFAKGKKVTLNLNGKTYTSKTNAKGQVTFTLKITKKGKFTTSIKYAGDTTYKSASKSVKITIK